MSWGMVPDGAGGPQQGLALGFSVSPLTSGPQALLETNRREENVSPHPITSLLFAQGVEHRNVFQGRKVFL